MTEFEKMLKGELYDSTDPQLIAGRRNCRSLIFEFNHTSPAEVSERALLLKKLLGKAGNNIEIQPPFYCDYGSNIEAGDNLYINYNCTILDCNKVIIGNNVMLGPNVQLYTAYHPLKAEERIKGLELALPITLGDNVWLGGGVIICQNVSIGENTTIGAGSVVTKDIPSNVFAAGNPCRIIKSID